MKKLIIIIGIILILAVSGYFIYIFFKPLDICQLLNNPRKYSGKEVEISGKVTVSFNLLGNSVYELIDKKGSCTIKVLSSKITPNKDEIITVKGKLEESFSLGSEKLLVFVEN